MTRPDERIRNPRQSECEHVGQAKRGRRPQLRVLHTLEDYPTQAFAVSGSLLWICCLSGSTQLLILHANHIAGHYRYMPIETLYVTERQMQHNRMPLTSILLLATLLLLTAGSIAATSPAADNLDQPFNDTIVLVHHAESAGATSSEISELMALLNRAVELSEEAAKLTSPSDAQKRADLQRQADEILATVETKATQLQAVASQRTFTSTVLTYVAGVIAAFVGTLVCAYGFSFWRRYRVKRTFEMRISPK